MTRKEIAAMNIGMTFDFIRSMVADPEAVASIPDGAELDFIGTDATVSRVAGMKGKTAKYLVGHVFEQVE
jgi:hypothetical protein